LDAYPSAVRFNRDGERVVGVRRAAQRIAAGHRAGAVAGDAQRQELPGRVPEPPRRDVRVPLLVRHREHQRPRLVGLGDDLGDLQFKDVVAQRLVGNRFRQDPSFLFPHN